MKRVIYFAMLCLGSSACKTNNDPIKPDNEAMDVQTAPRQQSNAFSAADYTLVLQDDFDGTTLNSRWNYRAENTTRGYAVVKRENVTLDGNGILSLYAKKDGNNYTVSQISTEQSFLQKYGYFECRAKINTSKGPHSAFWLQSPTVGNTPFNPATNGVEIDIFEHHRKFDSTRIFHNLHWNGYGTNHQTLGTSSAIPGIGVGFHTFALEWTPTEYVFYVDNVEKWRTSTSVSRRSEFLLFSMELTGFGGDPALGTYPDKLDIDYVKVYKPSKITFYQNCDYGGTQAKLGVGSYTTSQLAAMGITNNDLSALSIPAGLKVVLYDNDNFTGTSKQITADQACLSGLSFDNMTSSLVISAN